MSHEPPADDRGHPVHTSGPSPAPAFALLSSEDFELAAPETSMWQVRPDPTASVIVSAAVTGELAWFDDPGHHGDQHLAHLSGEGIATAVMLPVRPASETVAMLELCSTGRAPRSAAADAALRSIETEVAAAHRRVADLASATRWGRRSR